MAAPPISTDAGTLIERLREATELLESIAADRTVLAGVPDEERARLLQAVALVYHPDRVERRRMTKSTAKQRKAARVRGNRAGAHRDRHPRASPQARLPHAERLSARVLRARDVHELSDANVERSKIERLERFRTPNVDQHCYVCKQHFTRHPSLLRSALSRLRRIQLPQAHRARRSARTRGARHRRPRQDRLPGGAQAAARRRARHRHDAVSARLRAAIRPRGGLRRLGTPARDLRTRSAPHAERRSLLPRAAGDAHAARLHRQQRLPDGAPST